MHAMRMSRDKRFAMEDLPRSGLVLYRNLGGGWSPVNASPAELKKMWRTMPQATADEVNDAAGAVRSNPSSLPPGFDGFDDEEVVSAPAARSLPHDALRFIRELQKGDDVTFGKAKFIVYTDYTLGHGFVFLKKAGTKGAKWYAMSAESIYADGSVGIYPVLNITRDGPDVARGMPYAR